MDNFVFLLLQSQTQLTSTWKKVRVKGLTPSVFTISNLLATVAIMEKEYQDAIAAVI